MIHIVARTLLVLFGLGAAIWRDRWRHRVGDGAAHTGICRQAEKGAVPRTRELSTGGGEFRAADCSRSARGNPRSRF